MQQHIGAHFRPKQSAERDETPNFPEVFEGGG
jgi:hypothetical protein